jgi:hypothetical protein
MFKLIQVIAGVSLVLGGCADHSHLLVQGSSSEFLKGQFVHEGTSRLVLEHAQRKYVAEGFEIFRHRNLAELQKHYQMSEPKHWDRISSGLDRDHESYSAVARPKAQDGAGLICRLVWRSAQSPQGICLDKAGKEFAVRFDR